MSTVFVKASNRAKAYIRTSGVTRSLRKILKKGNSITKRKDKLFGKLNSQIHQAESSMRGGYLKSGGARLATLKARRGKLIRMHLK